MRVPRVIDRFCACAADAALDCLLTAIARDSTSTQLKSATFEALMNHTNALEEVLAAEGIEPDGEFGRRVVKAAMAAFSRRYLTLLGALASGAG